MASKPIRYWPQSCDASYLGDRKDLYSARFGDEKNEKVIMDLEEEDAKRVSKLPSTARLFSIDYEMRHLMFKISSRRKISHEKACQRMRGWCNERQNHYAALNAEDDMEDDR